MEALVAIFALALGIALACLLWLWRRASALSAAIPSPPEQVTPLFRAAMATLDAGLVLLDQERQVRYLNPQAELFLEVTHALALGQGLITLVRDYQVDQLVSEVLADGEARELVMQQLIGGRTLRLRALPLAADDLRGAVLLIHDVTQLNMLERARRDLVANVSHELRTPLASIKLLVETLQSDPPAPVAQRMLAQTAQEVDAVTQLVDELHELSQIELGRVALQLAPTSLVPIVARALERIQPQAARKSIRIDAHMSDRLPPALVDADRIGQVLLNLLHNAVKFTSENGKVHVSASVVTVGAEDSTTGYIERRLNVDPLQSPDRRCVTAILSEQGRPAVSIPQALTPGQWLMVTVSDTGVGIPARDLPRIFERFYKADRARTRNIGGTGLGLAIARHLVEGHGGCIGATSEEGLGSSFYFMLPIA